MSSGPGLNIFLELASTLQGYKILSQLALHWAKASLRLHLQDEYS